MRQQHDIPVPSVDHANQVDMELQDGAVMVTRGVTIGNMVYEVVFARPSTVTNEGRMFHVAVAKGNRQILGQLFASSDGLLTHLRLLG